MNKMISEWDLLQVGHPGQHWVAGVQVMYMSKVVWSQGNYELLFVEHLLHARYSLALSIYYFI